MNFKEQILLTLYFSPENQSNITRLMKLLFLFEEIFDLKDRKGFWGWFAGGKDAFLKIPAKIKKIEKAPSAYDLVVIGTPIWAMTISPAIRTYLSQNAEKLKRVAFFCTKGGTSSKGTFDTMEKLCGKPPLAELDIIPGEEITGVSIHKIVNFITEIKRSIKSIDV